eukprot:s1330_g15.t1
MEDIAADRFGLAFGSLQDIAPFLKEDKSISTDSLAVLTTSPVPPDHQGLMPVQNLRYPATYAPTNEAVLIDGSIVQLGDNSIARQAQSTIATAKTVDTCTYKITVWRDEWADPWDKFVVSPVKFIMEKTPRLQLCRGDKCGPGCQRFHSPVDCDLDQVIVDLWGRGWFSAKGKRSSPLEADQFQFLVRIPVVCLDGLQQRSGGDGIYYEPRQPDGRGPSEEFTVVWLNGCDKATASHKFRVSDRSAALVRFGGRFGIRVLAKDAETVHKENHPDTPFQNVTVQSVYEIRPLPHGMQTSGIRELLDQWGWRAKVLQPFKADQHGQEWLVGSDIAPPFTVFPTTSGDVIVSLHKKQEAVKQDQVVLTTAKTKSFMRKSAPTSKPDGGVMNKDRQHLCRGGTSSTSCRPF